MQWFPSSCTPTIAWSEADTRESRHLDGPFFGLPEIRDMFLGKDVIKIFFCLF